ncbi:MAG: LysM domain-containing protein [Deltaproteobacteria bacterium]|jgi:phage tail protein X|nr:LysM domain-containing protein [Deltaproteobacteria bacterium]
MKELCALCLVVGLLLIPPIWARAQDGQITQSYVVQKGDTINSIARKHYGKGGLGSKLWRANSHLVANPKRLTPGDTIFLFPESTLNLNKAVEMPPEPEASISYEEAEQKKGDKGLKARSARAEMTARAEAEAAAREAEKAIAEANADYMPTELYPKNQLLNQSFPKFVNFVSDIAGQGGGGATRIRIKKIDPVSLKELDNYYEVRVIGEIIASSDRGANITNSGWETTAPGRTLLSTRDNVSIRFTEDLAKILDSDTYDDSDPYFRAFPVYSVGDMIREPGKNRPDYGASVGRLMQFKGVVSIAARVEGLAPASPQVTSRVKRSTNGQNLSLEPVSYVGSITYTEEPILVSDKLLIFIPLDPGPERRLDPVFVEPPNSYISQGK